MKVDLLFGRDFSLWALETIDPECICCVFTLDSKIAALADRFGLEVFTEYINQVVFEPSIIGLSVHYPWIIRPPLLARYQNIYNLHPGYLP